MLDVTVNSLESCRHFAQDLYSRRIYRSPIMHLADGRLSRYMVASITGPQDECLLGSGRHNEHVMVLGFRQDKH